MTKSANNQTLKYFSEQFPDCIDFVNLFIQFPDVEFNKSEREFIDYYLELKKSIINAIVPKNQWNQLLKLAKVARKNFFSNKPKKT